MRLWPYMRIFIVFVLSSCGVKTEKYDYNNPVDPNATSVTSGGATNGAGPSAPAASSGTGATNNSTTLTPAGTSFNFVNAFSVTPQGCSAVKMVRVFDNNSDLMIFVQATCSGKSNVYAYRASYAGVATTVPTSVTNACTASGGIDASAVDVGTNNYLVIYGCYSLSTTYAVAVNKAAAASTPVAFSGYFDGPYDLAWNSAASSFALHDYYNRFQRFNEAGIAIGGKLLLSGSMGVSGNTWLMSQVGDSWVFTNKHSKYSSVGSSGSVVCSGIDPVPTMYVEKGIFITSNFFLRNYGSTISGDTVDSPSCSTGSPGQLVSGHQVDTLFNGFALTDTVGALLHTNYQNLLVSTFPLVETFSVFADSTITESRHQIMDNQIIISAQMKVINDKLYVAYAKNDGTGFIVYSNEDVAK